MANKSNKTKLGAKIKMNGDMVLLMLVCHRHTLIFVEKRSEMKWHGSNGLAQPSPQLLIITNYVMPSGRGIIFYFNNISLS